MTPQASAWGPEEGPEIRGREQACSRRAGWRRRSTRRGGAPVAGLAGMGLAWLAFAMPPHAGERRPTTKKGSDPRLRGAGRRVAQRREAAREQEAPRKSSRRRKTSFFAEKTCSTRRLASGERGAAGNDATRHQGDGNSCYAHPDAHAISVVRMNTVSSETPDCVRSSAPVTACEGTSTASRRLA